MEHIKEILAQSQSQGNIPNQKNFDSWDPPEPTPEERKESLRRRLNITSWDNTFENFRKERGVEKSLAAFKELASGKATWHMLLCFGTAGCGKTHLCEALSIELTKQNIVCRVREWSEIIRRFWRAKHSDYRHAYDDLFENIRGVQYLIIDDVGGGSTGSNWEWGELEDIVNYRYKNGLFTVVTTNLDIKANPKDNKQPFIPDRIVSRFRDAMKSRLILNSAKDFRPLKEATK